MPLLPPFAAPPTLIAPAEPPSDEPPLPPVVPFEPALLPLPVAPPPDVPAVALEETPPEPAFVGGESLHAGIRARHKTMGILIVTVIVNRGFLDVGPDEVIVEVSASPAARPNRRKRARRGLMHLAIVRAGL
jgi:hypothetical protein